VYSPVVVAATSAAVAGTSVATLWRVSCVVIAAHQVPLAPPAAVVAVPVAAVVADDPADS